MSIGSIIIAGTNSGCGKTTISIGIMAALCEKGLSVQPFKVGPDYIDPMFHTFITKRQSSNLDSWLLDEDAVLYIYRKNAMKADISVIEGVMGLYDGFGGNRIEGSTAHLSKITKSPVILVVNGRGASLSIVPVIKGFIDFDSDVDISGVIINNVNSEKHYNMLKRNIEELTGVHVLGYLPDMDEYALTSRHLGLVPDIEIKDLKIRIDKLVKQIRKTINIELLVKIAGQSKKYIETKDKTPFYQKERTQKVKVAVAKDKAFSFYYRENIDLLNMMGAEISYFSPLEDIELPKGINGLYIGGGYPEIFARELKENTSMRTCIKEHIQKGLPTYAECGGLMYMSEGIETKDGELFGMVGVIPGYCQMTDRLKRFGYVDIEVIRDNLISLKGNKIRAHEFHYSCLNLHQSLSACYKVIKNRSYDDTVFWECGYKVYNLFAAYPHIHFLSNTDFALRFIDNCEIKSFNV